MTTVQTHEQLLLRLAENGDPSAFYTLVAPFANIAYVSERNSGKGHNETLSSLIPHFKKIYKSFVQHPVATDFELWYKEREKKVFSGVQEVSIESLNDHNISGVLTADLSHFDWTLSLVFQRQYGKLKRSNKQRPLLAAGARYSRVPRIQKILFITGLIVIFGAGLLAYLSIAKKQVHIEIISGDSNQSVLSIHAIFRQPPASALNEFTSKEPAPQPLMKYDTIRIHDTIRWLGRPKPKPSASTPLGIGQVNPPGILGSDKKPSDTIRQP
jgi:hypothetical protein